MTMKSKVYHLCILLPGVSEESFSSFDMVQSFMNKHALNHVTLAIATDLRIKELEC